MSESAEEEREEGRAETPVGGAEAAAAQETLNQMMDAIRQAKVAELLLSTVSTLASVAYGKLEMKDLEEAKRAIDAIDVLLPLLEGQVDDGLRRDFGQGLANLKLAYADAVTKGQ